ncbi:MAG: hypothetical protein KKG47_14550 [Proteobacteria bacterium]|nr:hypothetical protein [Pseudomonadota bacterium]MBU1739260.1 hypothetical protein [Pseudomonadota bacterium]
MKTKINAQAKHLFWLTLCLAAFITLSGCMHTGATTGSEDGHETAVKETAIQNEPYYPVDYKDLLIPGELIWNREKSMSINTASFSGGILNFAGRVEVNSLTDFFINSMKKDGWEMTGSIKAKDVMLAFVKENGSCLIRIFEGYTLGKTEIVIYITHKN